MLNITKVTRKWLDLLDMKEWTFEAKWVKPNELDSGTDRANVHHDIMRKHIIIMFNIQYKDDDKKICEELVIHEILHPYYHPLVDCFEEIVAGCFADERARDSLGGSFMSIIEGCIDREAYLLKKLEGRK